MGLLLNCLAVGAGGFIGAVLRYLCGFIMPNSTFPWTTLIINIIGSFVMGFATALVLRGILDNERLSLFLRVGMCGGFSTLAAFSVEVVDMTNSSQFLFGGIYAIATLVICVSAAALGGFIASKL